MDNQNWYDYYRGYKPSFSNILLHADYLFQVYRHSGASVMEIGCGPATHSLFLKQIKPDIRLSLLDSDKQLLDQVAQEHETAIERAYHLDILNRDDVGSLPNFDLIISQGLMEHFSDQDLILIIKNFSSVGKRMIFSIPNERYPNRDFGNEILRSSSQISTLLEMVPGIKFTIRNVIDPGIRTKLEVVKKNKLTGSDALKFLLAGSCHLICEIVYEGTA